MQDNPGHGCDVRRCGIGIEHADRGITSKKFGSLPLCNREGFELHFLELEPDIWKLKATVRSPIT